MKVQTLCRNCSKYFAFFDDCGEVLVDGCKLDIPLFDSRKAIVCNSYTDRERML